MKKSSRVVKIEFSSPPRAVITFADSSTSEVTGILAVQWRSMIEAAVCYEREHLYAAGITDFWKYLRTIIAAIQGDMLL